MPLAPRTGHAVAYVGTMDERKGVRYIAEAMGNVAKAVPDVELHVMGNPPEISAQGYTGECLRSLRATLGPRLVLHGQVPSCELFSILDGCRVLVAPSLEEMFGNQLIEGLMRGCHGIVAEGTALAENARRFGNSMTIPQRDASAIACSLVSTLSEPFDPLVAEEARQRIRDWMSPTVVAEQHVSLYHSIIGEASA